MTRLDAIKWQVSQSRGGMVILNLADARSLLRLAEAVTNTQLRLDEGLDPYEARDD